jgi:glyoxylase-like metal-dependent hydrolase (beta-lactamase superfamily II)
MAEIKILIEGYAKKFEHGWLASSTVCLIKTSDGKKIITDPGCNREKLLEALKKENLTTGEIDYIFISHAHLDHSLLAGIFENAKLVTYDANSTYDQDKIDEFEAGVLGPDVEVIDTPGHMLEHISLLVTTPQGKVAIAGDCIFFLVDEEQKFDINQKDHSEAKGMNMETLIKSRKKLIELADYIIPGHGKMFKVEK